MRYQALVASFDSVGVKISGKGTIDGNGDAWNSQQIYRGGTQRGGRPHLVEFHSCVHVEVEQVTLRRSAFWCLHPVYSRDIHIHDITLYSDLAAPNADGIDPDSSSDIVIERCSISVGDDNIAIKSGWNAPGRRVGMPSRNITIRDNVHGVEPASCGPSVVGTRPIVWGLKERPPSLSL